MHRPWVLGLTGGIGSGKSAAADILQQWGATVVDTDQLAHRLTAPHGAAMPALIQAFGTAIAAADGSMNRAAMRERVFHDPAARQQLEAILHPMIQQAAEDAVQQAEGMYVVLVVPLLFETGHYTQRVHRTLVVDCPEDIQIARVMQRSQLDADMVRRIMAQQWNRQRRLAAADDVVDNQGSLAELQAQLWPLHQAYLEKTRLWRANTGFA